MNSRSTRAQTGAGQPGLDRPPEDFFVTDPASTLALLSVEGFPGTVWEPACGDGTMAEVLRTGIGVRRVVASDVIDRGYPGTIVHDFLTSGGFEDLDHVVTNPPFDLANQFVKRAIEMYQVRKIAMFMRLVWLEGSKRRASIFDVDPPSRVWVFSKRQRLKRNGQEWQTGLIAFAWFVWDRDHVGRTELGWL